MTTDMRLKKNKLGLSLFWFRRDLRLEDNAGLYHLLKDSKNVQALFIFDPQILRSLSPDDARVGFIYDQVLNLKEKLNDLGSDLWVYYGEPLQIFSELFRQNSIQRLYLNHDYEPAAIRRDQEVEKLCQNSGVSFASFKDQVIFEKSEIVTEARKPYTVYTPYKNKWLAGLSEFYLKSYSTDLYFHNLQKHKQRQDVLGLKELGFIKRTDIIYPDPQLVSQTLKNYEKKRDFPALGGTSRLGLHLRFGTLSVRELARAGVKFSSTWLSELVWREFFMQILFHFPRVEKKSFRPEYEKIKWRRSPEDFMKWVEGRTGYPLVDAGMRELAATGYMHNRVRMVTASFLTKHLLIHWSEGERYFAQKLLDFELAANNGNWQWAAGTGCDAAPYFRIFNPEAQLKKFDEQEKYIRRWLPEYGTSRYVQPMVEHKAARDRCLRAFHLALKGKMT
jgi:deoxyribodipyrimidine photo-lyase